MAPAKRICATVARANSIDPMRLSIHNMPNRIELEFFRCAQQAVSGITGDRVYPAEVLNGSAKHIRNIG